MNSNKYAAFGNDISSLSIISCEVITLPLSSLIRPREVGERSQSLSIGRGSKLRETDETHGVDNSRRYDKSPHYRKSRPYRDQTNCGPLEFVN